MEKVSYGRISVMKRRKANSEARRFTPDESPRLFFQRFCYDYSNALAWTSESTKAKYE
jgi:hypothetical protein